MPVSRKELEELMAGDKSRMGLAYVPFTFPTLTVADNMRVGGVPISSTEVDRMWTAYEKGAMAGAYKAFAHDGDGANNLAIIKYMETDTGFPRMNIIGFLNATEKAVKETGWGWRWLDPANAATSEKGSYSPNLVESAKTALADLGQGVGGFLKPVADPITNLVKWAAVLVVGGAVIYGVYHGTKIFKARRRKRS